MATGHLLIHLKVAQKTDQKMVKRFGDENKRRKVTKKPPPGNARGGSRRLCLLFCVSSIEFVLTTNR